MELPLLNLIGLFMNVIQDIGGIFLLDKREKRQRFLKIVRQKTDNEHTFPPVFTSEIWVAG